MTKPITTEELFEQSGGGAKIHFNKYSQPGDSVEGTVIHSQVQQARDFDDNTLLFWDDGNPKQQLVVTLQTRLRDRSIEDDDGSRRVFLRWWGTDRTNTINAVQKAGDKFVRDGSWMRVTFTGLGEAVGKKNPPKIYGIDYKAPPSDTEVLMTKEEPAGATVTEIPRQPAPQQATEPQPDLIQAAAAAQSDRRAQIAKVQKLATAGFSAEDIEGMVAGISRQAIEAILAL